MFKVLVFFFGWHTPHLEILIVLGIFLFGFFLGEHGLHLVPEVDLSAAPRLTSHVKNLKPQDFK